MRARTVDATTMSRVVAGVVMTMTTLANEPIAWGAPAPARVVVRAETLQAEQASRLRPLLRARVEAQLHDRYAVPIVPQADVSIAVELRPIVEARDPDKVIFQVSVLAADDTVCVSAPTSCWACDEASLIESVLHQVELCTAHLPEAEPPDPSPVVGPEPSPVPVPVPVSTVELLPRPEPGSPPADSAEVQAPLRAAPRPRLVLRNVGLSLTAAGLSIGAVGVGLWAAEPRRRPGGPEHIVVRDLRPPAVALMAVGGAVLVGGVVSLAIHGVRRRRASRVARGPRARPGWAVLSMDGRW